MKRTESIAELLADYIARTVNAGARNADPYFVVAERETGAELLAAYLEHVVANRGARRLIAAARKDG